jgi:hypothetical protein
LSNIRENLQITNITHGILNCGNKLRENAEELNKILPQAEV